MQTAARLQPSQNSKPFRFPCNLFVERKPSHGANMFSAAEAWLGSLVTVQRYERRSEAESLAVRNAASLQLDLDFQPANIGSGTPRIPTSNANSAPDSGASRRTLGSRPLLTEVTYSVS